METSVQPADLNPDQVRRQFNRIVSSPGFAHSPRLTRFLQFIIEKALAGDTDSLQEYVIGLEVFDRRESFDPKGDSIVRVEAHRLRNRLSEFYAGEGCRDAVVIELPGRGYVPKLRKRAAPYRAKVVAAAAVLAIAAGFGLSFLSKAGQEVNESGTKSIGVLPFTNFSPNGKMAYFCDSLADSLVADLTQIRSLRVISRTSLARYRNSRKSIPEIGRELGLDYIIEGGVLASDDKIRVTAQLIHATADKHLWARTYERPAGKILDVQRSLVADIANEVALNLTPEDKAQVRMPPTGNPLAYEAYLKGMSAWNQWTGTGSANAVEFFSIAVKEDPGFALAHAWLAGGYRQGILTADWPGPPTLAKAMAAATTAVQLQPNLGAAHFSLGSSLAHVWDWEEAEREYLNAIRLEPGNGLFHHGYAIICLAPTRRLAEAEAEIRRARRLDPASLTHMVILGKILYFRRRYDEAASQLKEALHLDPNFADAWRNLGSVLLQQGLHSEAIAAFRRAQELAPSNWGWGLLAHALSVSGNRPEAQRILGTLLSGNGARRPLPALAIATAYTGQGPLQEAYQWLEQAVGEGQDFRVAYLQVDPLYGSLRADPRFGAAVARLRLR